MIGQIRGIIIEKQPPYLLLDVGGIGYEILAPMSTFYLLPELQQTTMLYTHLTIREDGHYLYGFHHKKDRKLFRSLIKVNGVGPKLALTILSGIDSNEFVRCVLQGDASRLISIPGIGKKTAERLMIETKDTLSTWELTDFEAAINNSIHHTDNQPIQDAISALIALGYKSTDAKRAVMQVQAPNYSREDMIRLALKKVMGGAE